jgi:hypothetical protein
MYSRRATYNELVVVHFGVRREQRKREAREEKEQPGRRRRHGESEMLPRRRSLDGTAGALLVVAFL